jgi:hypothetical protein
MQARPNPRRTQNARRTQNSELRTQNSELRTQNYTSPYLTPSPSQRRMIGGISSEW